MCTYPEICVRVLKNARGLHLTQEQPDLLEATISLCKGQQLLHEWQDPTFKICTSMQN